MPAEIKARALKEVDRMSRIQSASPEVGVIRTYVDWLVGLPWNVSTTDRLDIKEAAKILDEDHYGLEKIKERILEFLAVRALVKKPKATILTFAGPPGVGKTSLAKSIARAMNRRFVRLSLGGVRDEAEVRGHRRTDEECQGLCAHNAGGGTPRRKRCIPGLKALIKGASRSPVWPPATPVLHPGLECGRSSSMPA